MTGFQNAIKCKGQILFKDFEKLSCRAVKVNLKFQWRSWIIEDTWTIRHPSREVVCIRANPGERLCVLQTTELEENDYLSLVSKPYEIQLILLGTLDA